MTLVQVVLLGIVQGLTEFLPISSSAHLVLTPYFLGWRFPPQEIFIFDVLVQVASLVAVIAYFKDELWGIGRAWLMGLASRRPFADPLARRGVVAAFGHPAGRPCGVAAQRSSGDGIFEPARQRAFSAGYRGGCCGLAST